MGIISGNRKIREKNSATKIIFFKTPKILKISEFQQIGSKQNINHVFLCQKSLFPGTVKFYFCIDEKKGWENNSFREEKTRERERCFGFGSK